MDKIITSFFMSYTVLNNEGSLLFGNAIASIEGEVSYLSQQNVQQIHTEALRNAVKTYDLDLKDIKTFTLTSIFPLGSCTEQEFTGTLDS